MPVMSAVFAILGVLDETRGPGAETVDAGTGGARRAGEERGRRLGGAGRSGGAVACREGITEARNGGQAGLPRRPRRGGVGDVRGSSGGRRAARGPPAVCFKVARAVTAAG